MVIELSIQKFNPKVLVVSHAIVWGRVAHTSIMLMCDTTRHDSMRHNMTEDQGTTIFYFGATHTTTRPCD